MHAQVCLSSRPQGKAKAAHCNYSIRQLDIGNAFVEAYLPPEEEVYMDSIPGFERPVYAIKLVKSLYGLKQSPKHWADLLSDFLIKLGYKRSSFDSCLYQYKDAYTKKEINIACYVDDLLITSCKEYIDQLVYALQQQFTVRDLGEPSTFLGMEVKRNRKKKTISISQPTYIRI